MFQVSKVSTAHLTFHYKFVYLWVLALFKIALFKIGKESELAPHSTIRKLYTLDSELGQENLIKLLKALILYKHINVFVWNFTKVR